MKTEDAVRPAVDQPHEPDRLQAKAQAKADTPAPDETTPAESPAPDADTPAAGPAKETPDIDALVREAYLRGRNEAIDALMRQPAMMQPLEAQPRRAPEGATPAEVMILNSPHVSIWDR